MSASQLNIMWNRKKGLPSCCWQLALGNPTLLLPAVAPAQGGFACFWKRKSSQRSPSPHPIPVRPAMSSIARLSQTLGIRRKKITEAPNEPKVLEAELLSHFTQMKIEYVSKCVLSYYRTQSFASLWIHIFGGRIRTLSILDMTLVSVLTGFLLMSYSPVNYVIFHKMESASKTPLINLLQWVPSAFQEKYFLPALSPYYLAL